MTPWWPRQGAPRRLFGWSEVWRDDTITRTFDLLFIRIRQTVEINPEAIGDELG